MKKGLAAKFVVLVVLIVGLSASVLGQSNYKPYSPANGTTYEEVVVETSLNVRRPATVLRRQQLLAPKEKGAFRSRREISHSTGHEGSKLKANALNAVVGHEKNTKTAGHSTMSVSAFFDKGFKNGASKAEQRAFLKQKPVTSKKNGNQLV